MSDTPSQSVAPVAARKAKADSNDAAKADPNDVASLSFEAALAELDGIVKKLEGGQAKLEEAIADYERGAALRRHCETKLAEAEQKVQAIVAGGTLRDLT